MAKILFLIRHAKSSWDDPAVADFDRPLNDRGKRDAPEMAKRLAEKKADIDAFVTSPAKRAKQTCKRFAKQFDVLKKKVVEDRALYEAGREDFYNVISGFKNKWDSVAVFSHNPGITSFINELTENKIDDMPTCGIFALKVNAERWEDFPLAPKEFWFFESPKMD